MSKCVSCNGVLIDFEKYKFKSRVFRRVYTSKYLFRCDQCELIQADCGAVDRKLLDEYYVIHYRQNAGIGGSRNDSETLLYQARGSALATMIAEMIAERSNNPISVLEVGAGLGFNLMAVKKAIPEASVYSSEPDKTAPSYFQDDDPAILHDFIILSHVLEHVTNPVQFLNGLGERLKPGGYIIIEVPNDKHPSMENQLFYEPHILFFTLFCLQSVLEKTTLQTVDLFDAGPAVRQLNWKNKIAPLLPDWLKDALRRQQTTVPLDFTKRNTGGMYLRAVLQKDVC